jgi:hypothetical protein
MWLFLIPVLMLLAACAAPSGRAPPVNEHIPPFARVPYEPFTRTTVVALALREWRLFGSPVDDDPPGTYHPATPEDKPERQQGLWQRVGDYWWEGLNPGDPDSGWTGKHDGSGIEFPASQDGSHAWSAAFVSYVMRIAGAGARFPYSASHSDYIDAAKRQALGQVTGWVVTTQRVESYAPQPGDLICMGRANAHELRYDDLPAGHFPGHCDFVVDTSVQGQISVIGGNIDDAVTMKHIPVTTDGKLATPDGLVLDSRYPWMVVLQVVASEPVA